MPWHHPGCWRGDGEEVRALIRRQWWLGQGGLGSESSEKWSDPGHDQGLLTVNVRSKNRKDINFSTVSDLEKEGAATS